MKLIRPTEAAAPLTHSEAMGPGVVQQGQPQAAETPAQSRRV